MKHKRKIGKFFFGMLSLVLISAVSFGAIFAWNSHIVAQENNLQSRTVSAEIEENFPDTTAEAGATKVKEVSFKNTGTGAAFLRVSFSENWETSTNLLDGDYGVVKNWTTAWTTEWVDGGDGWFYYNKVLGAGESTATILSGVEFPSDIPENADYNLTFLAEVIQVSDEDAVNTDATNKLFGKTGQVSNAVIENGAVTSGTVSWS